MKLLNGFSENPKAKPFVSDCCDIVTKCQMLMVPSYLLLLLKFFFSAVSISCIFSF